MKNFPFKTKMKYLRFRFSRFARRKIIPAWFFYRGQRLWRIIIAILLIIGGQIGYALFISPHAAKAEWADDSYGFRQRFSFTHNAALTTPTSITVTISTSALISAGVLQSDCDDIRFTDINGLQLLYQITGTCNNASTTYEVIFPTIISGANVGYVYYGNATAFNGSQNVSTYTQLTPSGGDPAALTTRTNEEKGQTPLLYWAFNENRGTTANDMSGFDNDGTITNAVWNTRDLCAFDSCLYFDGTGDYVSRSYAGVTDSELVPASGDMSIALWFRSTSPVSATQVLLSRVDGVNGIGYKVYLNATANLCFGTDDVAGTFPANSVCSTLTYADSQWHQVEVVKTGTTSQTLYIDGKYVAQGAAPAGSISGTNAPMYAGSDNGGSNAFTGFLDEIKIFAYAKTAEQVRTDYASKGNLAMTTASFGYTQPEKSLSNGLVGYWKMDESSWGTTDCTTKIVLDASGNKNDGAVCNASGSSGPPTVTPAKFLRGGQFNGNGGGVNIATASALLVSASDNFTLSTWVKRTGNATFGNAMYMFDSQNLLTDAGFYIITATDGCTIAATSSLGHICFAVSDGTNSYSLLTNNSTLITADSLWHHVVAVLDRKNLENTALYVDGQKQAVTTTGTLEDVGGLGSNALCLGKNLAGPSCETTNGNNTFNGYLDDMRMYKRALTVTEVQTLYEWGPYPTAYWNLNENSGTSVSNLSTNNYTGTLTNGPVWQEGKYGSGLSYDGVDDYTDFGNVLSFSGNQPMSISAWVNVKSLPATSRGFILSKYDVGINGSWYFAISSIGAIQINRECGSFSFSSNSVITVGEWHHVVATYDGTTTKIYKDGIFDRERIESCSSPTSTQRTLMGAGDNGGSNTEYYLNAVIDDVRMYDYALQPKQILENYNADHPIVGTPVAGSVGYWRFDEGAGTTAYDATLNGNNLGTSAPNVWTENGKFNRAWHGSGLDWATPVTNSINASFNMPSWQDFAISMWFKSSSATNPTAAEYLLSKASVVTGAQSPGYVIYVNPSGQVVFGITDAADWGIGGADNPTPKDLATSTNDLYDGTWHHILATKTGISRIDLYVDGKQNASDTTLASSGDLINSNALAIGNNNPGPNNGFTGDIDETKVYKGLLTIQEVLTEYNQGKIAVFGALSTESDGITASNSMSRSYCVPGDTAPCTLPAGEWLFDENTATMSAKDTSGNGITGTANGNVFYTRAKVGSGIQLDGDSDYYSMDNNINISDSDALTISAWIYPTSDAQNMVIVSKKYLPTDATIPGYTLYWWNTANGGNICFYVSDGSANGSDQYETCTADNTTNTLNRWYHIVAVYDNNSFAGSGIYINGVNAEYGPYETCKNCGAGTPDFTQIGSLTTTYPLCVGIQSTNSTTCGTIEDFSGILDQVRIYKYARTSAQIAWEYNRGSPVGLWKFDECNGPTAYDSTATANNEAGGKNGTWSGATGTNTSFGDCTTNATTARYTGKNGKFGSSLDFDATDDVVTVTNTSVLDLNDGLFGGFTFSAWIFPDTAGEASTGRIFDKGTNTYCYTTNLISGKLDLVCRLDLTTSATFTVPAAIPTGQWSHVALSWTNDADDEITVWINGTPFTSSALYSGDPNADTSNFLIGNNSAGSATFDGLIDDVRVYPYELTGVQIKTLMNENAAVRFGPLTGTP